MCSHQQVRYVRLKTPYMDRERDLGRETSGKEDVTTTSAKSASIPAIVFR